MSIAQLPPINVVGGITIDPLAANSWVPNQVAYLVVFNTTQFPLIVTTSDGPTTIQPGTANEVPTHGLKVTISAPTYPLYPSSTALYGAVLVSVYDESESEPVGFPSILPVTQAGQQMAYQISSYGPYPPSLLMPIPPGFTQFTVTQVVTGIVNSMEISGNNGSSSHTIYENTAELADGTYSYTFWVSNNDTSLNIECSGASVTITAYPGVTPVYTVNVANPAAGADWTYTLPAPARLVGVDTEMLTSAAVANRTPFLEWGTGVTTPQVGNSTPIVASQTSFVHFATGYVDSNYSSGGITIQKTGIPSLLLPAGTILKSGTIGLQATDQWLNVALTFSAE